MGMKQQNLSIGLCLFVSLSLSYYITNICIVVVINDIIIIIIMILHLGPDQTASMHVPMCDVTCNKTKPRVCCKRSNCHLLVLLHGQTL